MLPETEWSKFGKHLFRVGFFDLLTEYTLIIFSNQTAKQISEIKNELTACNIV